MAAARTRRSRLPGFRFEAQPPPLAEALPRMDVAAFVGFAAEGPVGVPVALEDAALFDSVFGGEVSLAWDHERGERVAGHLASAVRAFFGNGGRRCWVVRVAGPGAQSNRFAVPGLLRLTKGGALVPAVARARAAGSWSDSLQTDAVLLSRPFVVSEYVSAREFKLELSSPNDIVRGDLLRLSAGGGYVLMAVVGSVEPLAPSHGESIGPAPRSASARVRAREARWFRVPDRRPEVFEGRARVFTADGRELDADADAPADFVREGVPGAPLELALASQVAPAPGSFVRADFGAEQLWLRARQVRVVRDAGRPGSTLVQVSGDALWWLGDAKVEPTGAGLPTCERLLFELRARRGDASPLRLSDLAFAAEHPRFWSALPTDERLYEEPRPRGAEARAELGRAAAGPRFPVAGNEADEGGEPSVYFPVAMPVFSGDFLGPHRNTRDPLERDGLADFGTSLFLDPDLDATGIEDLLTRADFLRYQSPSPRTLKGIHAALALEEATIIAVPDAAHRGWTTVTDAAPQPLPSEPLPHPEWWGYLDCERRRDIPAGGQPERGHFLDCRLRRIDAPTLQVTQPDAAGAIVLNWSSELDARTYTVEEASGPDFRGAATVYEGADARVVLEGRDRGRRYFHRVRSRVAGVLSDWVELRGEFDERGALVLTWLPPLRAGYVLEESATPDWSTATVLHRGLDNGLRIYGRHAGNYFYRVRAEVGELTSDWSNGVAARVATGGRWQLKPTAGFRADTLLEVQCALLRMCAARGDLFALLSLPEHYREQDAVRHVAALKPPSRLSQADDTRATEIVPLRYGETRALSFGALYHPWLLGAGQGARARLRRTPPDGAAAGVLAGRAFSRGAWVAPANEWLRGVVALDPPLGRASRQALQDAQVNVVRREPRGFLVMSADTLSDEADWRPIGVRRLISLIRRMALREGATYVFEPHNDAFHRLVRRGFERMLGVMFTRGAFAGATHETAFRVVTDSTINTRRSMEQGHFVVELKVAPSLPLNFLTIRLVQSGDRGLATEER